MPTSLLKNKPPGRVLAQPGACLYAPLAQLVAQLTHTKAVNDELRLNYSKRDFTMYRANLIYAPLAQLVEQLTLNQWVLGSSPRWCTTNSHTIYFVWLFLIVVAIFGGQLLWPLTWLIVSGLFCFSKEILQI